MLSRIADSLFWLARYMERAEGLLRVTTTHNLLSLDKDVNGPLTWRSVLETFTSVTGEELNAIEGNTGAALKKLLTDATNNNSLKSIIGKARENARGIQDYITKEVWEEVNSFYHLINQPALDSRLSNYEAADILDLFTRHSVLYTGITDITMARGIGWGFMNLGKYIERCLETIVLTDKQYAVNQYKVDEIKDIMQWRHLLMSLSGYELHLKTYRSYQYTHDVLHQVLFNEDFPHSVIYSLGRIDRHLQDVTKGYISEENAALIRNFGRLHSKVKHLEIDDLNNQTLKPFLEDLRHDLLHFTNLFSQKFFSYA
ncbi:alpha-E domain-containing protein [Chitinophaga ginsengisoli]|uniref:Putative alpha-E superfamily protein n=1 Tax=Chitinophaga ginsengisoli TaxID=363837 RepID=A0A2P8FDZ5_9BACT|nr:alpha-E domain-containing protein [Chitinophaga ginsengisoli]PSL19934.1 putative alpha-E superfamily protein [Chitinophaga ginsengisoli]